MELIRLVAALERLDEVPLLARGRSLVVSFAPADTVVALGSLEGRIGGPIGIWLDVSLDYPAQMAARDVATLSWIVDLDHIVIASDSQAPQHADVVRALLSDDEVNFSNALATLTGAFNRPAPPRALNVWSFDAMTLRSPGRAPLVAAVEDTISGETRFA